MEIGIIGAGKIGSTLGKQWAATGHEVLYGVRDPQDARYDPLRISSNVDSVDKAISFGEVVVLALPGSAVADFISNYAGALDGKMIIDTTNNPRSAQMNSLALIAERVSNARLVRAFSTLGWENFAKPEIWGVQIDLFYCGDASARADVEKLIAHVGLRPVYIGNLDTAGALDGMTRVWFALVSGQGYSRRAAFKLLVER